MAKAEGIQWEDSGSMAKAEDYITIDGWRYVRPYFFEFVAHVKRRWEGQEIARFFSSEFRQRTYEYYVQAIADGRILVGGQKVDPTFCLKDSQTMTHFVHRHEPRVSAQKVEVLSASPDVLTVCKPATVPVHPCGQYRKNTVVGILQAEGEYGQLFPIHRLDRLVSGLLILARNPQAADRFRLEIVAGTIRKEYVAKVVGVFPEGEMEVPAAVESYPPPREKGRKGDQRQKGAKAARAPVPETDSRQRSRSATTVFLRVSTDGESSIVTCRPVTGRTHQIRIHLQHLGHPIANDALYLAPPTSRVHSATSADAAARRALTQRAAEGEVGDGGRAGVSEMPAGKRAAQEEDRCNDRSEGRGVGEGGGMGVRGRGGGSVEEGVSKAPRLEGGVGEDCTRDGRGGGGGGGEGGDGSRTQQGSVGVGRDGKGMEEGGVVGGKEGKGEGGRGVSFEVDPLCTHCPNLGPTR